jgi:light-regulated signal transduction histidine kinase (bacteriophytochrome)
MNHHKVIQCNIRDITDRKRAEEGLKLAAEKLEVTNKELEQFAYIASHDLREPLRKITAFGGLLKESLKGRLDQDDRENLDFMIDGATRMQNIIDDLLSYSRLTTQAKPFDTVDLNETVKQLSLFELSEALKETGGIVEIEGSLPKVAGDESQIRQLLQNLIGNGIKFHLKNKPPAIIIRAKASEEGNIRIEVVDNGIGIDEKFYEKIFIMFTRLHSRSEYDGTGIGLAICKKIVERHGGQIGVVSKPGEGSTFWFTLPGVS